MGEKENTNLPEQKKEGLEFLSGYRLANISKTNDCKKEQEYAWTKLITFDFLCANVMLPVQREINTKLNKLTEKLVDMLYEGHFTKALNVLHLYFHTGFGY